MEQFRYQCLYCNFGRDTESLVLNHMSISHTKQANFPCRNEPCHFSPRKVFRTAVHRKRHEDFCGAEKKYVCQFCEKKYKRKKSYDNHIYVGKAQGYTIVIYAAETTSQKIHIKLIIGMEIVLPYLREK